LARLFGARRFDGDNGQFMLDGQATNYSTNYLAGYCHDGIMEPI
jgi:hypothetical protein